MKLAWQLRAKLPEYRRAVSRSKKIVEQALKTARFALSWSAGKDSTAMVHLVKHVDASVPIIIQFDDCDWPGKRGYAREVSAEQGWEFHAVEPDFSVWDAIIESKIGFENVCAQSHWLTKDSFLRPLMQKQQELGCDGVFIGLRADESRARRLNYYLRGNIYRLRDGTWRCNPLSHWKAADVFAYHMEHNIKINPYYFNNRFQKPEDLRLSWAFPSAMGARFGDIEHIRFYYPEQYQRLRKRYGL